MSGLSASEIDHLAELARLSLSESEKERFSKELPKIAEFVEALQSAKLPDTKHSELTELEHLREDIPGENGLSADQLKVLSPQWENNQNVVPPVFGGEDNA